MAKLELAQLEQDFKTSELRDAVLRRLKEGDSTFSVATWLQNDLLLYTEYTPSQLSSAVKEMYIHYVPLEERMGLSKNRSAIQRTAEKNRRHTSALEEMQFLYDVQKGRINLLHEAEMDEYEKRIKAREDAAFAAELEEVLAEDDKKGKKKKDESAGILFGLGANEIETARRMLVDIHKMSQDLNLQPNQRGTAELGDTAALTADYKAKRAKVVKEGLRRYAMRQTEEEEVVSEH
jgi:hypothetical protein